MTATTIRTMAGEIGVIVPDDIENITAYVLEEQQDWFEDEIHFVRKLLGPGQTVIDIGANLGVYALSMAALVGPRGRVYAFEPAASCAALLQASADLNGFDQITVEQRGVAAHSGAGWLASHRHAELNQLRNPELAQGRGEKVQLTSLDQWVVESGCTGPISLIKIDAEGQELNILRGAERLLAEGDPLILYELKHDEIWNLDLVEAFAIRGYQSYRLLPGPQLLVPFRQDDDLDIFLLNLFCCKPVTARQLAAAGRLVEPAAKGKDAAEVAPSLEPAPAHGWQASLSGLAYAERLRPSWLRRELAGAGIPEPISLALALHALSTDTAQPPPQRAAALGRCLELLLEACRGGAGPIHLASLARAAVDAGERVLARDALDALINALPWMTEADLEQPFLAPSPRFAALTPVGPLHDWLMLAAIETHERMRHYSSFFTGAQQRQRIPEALSLGYESEMLRRRLALINRRFPQH